MSLNMVGIAYYAHLWPPGQAFHSFYQILQVSEAARGFAGNARMFFKLFHVWKCEVSESGAQLGEWVRAEGWVLGVRPITHKVYPILTTSFSKVVERRTHDGGCEDTAASTSSESHFQHQWPHSNHIALPNKGRLVEAEDNKTHVY